MSTGGITPYQNTLPEMCEREKSHIAKVKEHCFLKIPVFRLLIVAIFLHCTSTMSLFDHNDHLFIFQCCTVWQVKIAVGKDPNLFLLQQIMVGWIRGKQKFVKHKTQTWLNVTKYRSWIFVLGTCILTQNKKIIFFLSWFHFQNIFCSKTITLIFNKMLFQKKTNFCNTRP